MGATVGINVSRKLAVLVLNAPHFCGGLASRAKTNVGASASGCLPKDSLGLNELAWFWVFEVDV